MIAYLQGISRQRASWILLLASAVLLELGAMGFQHGLGLSPCVMCIYARIATVGLVAAALVALINPNKRVLGWLGIVLWGLR